MKRSVYICGPIAGMPDGNKFAFREAQYELMYGEFAREELIAVNPHDIPPWKHEHECPEVYGFKTSDGHDGGCHLREDIARLVRCHIIFCLKGWEMSKGARIEHNLAKKLGLEIWYEKE